MDKLVPFVGKRDERRDAKVDALLQQQLLITWLRESIKLPARLFSDSVFLTLSLSPCPFPQPPLRKINDQIK